MNNTYIRYIVKNPYQSDSGYSASYNLGLGEKIALFYARLNAKLFHGEIFGQTADNQTVLLESYVRIAKS